MHRIEILCIAINTIQFNAVNRITKVEKVDLFAGGYNALHILICGSNKIEVSLKVAALCMFHPRCACVRAREPIFGEFPSEESIYIAPMEAPKSATFG